MRVAALAAAVLVGGCAPRAEPPTIVAEGRTPDLAAVSGGLGLSWVEGSAAGHALRFAARHEGRWADPVTIASGAGWLVNFADRAGLVGGPDGAIAAHWREGGGVRISLSRDGGGTWSDPVAPHAADSATERGFASLAPAGGGFVVAWLDGREGENPMTLRAAALRADGTVGNDTLLDHLTCDCCPTDAVAGEAGVVVAYRDRSETEVRDIATCRLDLATGVWSEPVAVHADGWRIAGCPVDGPAVAAGSGIVACAWYTLGADGEPRVNVATSRDDGRTFGPPLRIDAGDPAGRCDLVALADGSWLASWVERRGETSEIRVRRITAEGRMDPSRVAATVAIPGDPGFPRLAVADDGAWLAWTDDRDPSPIRCVRVR